MKWGDQWPAKHDLSRLRLLGSVGEPINPEAWMWYREKIGGNRCPIVDTWWQTETGAIVISPLPGVTATKPGSATTPLPGYTAALLDAKANEIKVGGGLLALTKPWPSMLRTIWGDDERYVQTYFSKWPGRPDLYFPGDGAKRDDDGYYWILGRVDDVLNVAGHRIGTMEVESALVEHPAVAEAAVVGKTHELKGQALAAFVTLREGFKQQSASCAKSCATSSPRRSARSRKPDDILFSRGSAEDAIGQDHAPAAARHRRGTRARRHDDARRSERGGESEGSVRGAGELRTERGAANGVRGDWGPERLNSRVRCRISTVNPRSAPAFQSLASHPLVQLVPSVRVCPSTPKLHPCSPSFAGSFPNASFGGSSSPPPSDGCGSRRPAPRKRSSARTSTTR